ncbi:hypothetical protein UlMin_005736 [Ulmus minor]
MKAEAILLNLVLGFSIFFFFMGVQSVTFTITNNCTYTIWPGTLTGAGKPQLSSTGFELQPGSSQTLDVPGGWSGRLWARSGCSIDATGKFSCSTADCASGSISCNGAGAIPPATLVEITLNGNGNQDYYDVSLVDGFNLPVMLAPEGGCNITKCAANVNLVCPPPLAVMGADGSVIACKSACLVFNQPQYCCTGDFGTPDRCPPTNYSLIFKNQCPTAYTYAFDDKTSLFTCASGANYAITFCPS